MYGMMREKLEVGTFLKFSLKYKEVLMSNKVEEINRKMVLKGKRAL